MKYPACFQPSKIKLQADINSRQRYCEHGPDLLDDNCYQSKSTVLGAKPHLSPSLTPLSRETANDGCFGKEGYRHETLRHGKVVRRNQGLWHDQAGSRWRRAALREECRSVGRRHNREDRAPPIL